MAWTVEDLITSTRNTQLNDPEGTTWPNSSMLNAINEALRTLVLARPDSTSTKAVITSVAGTEQKIPEDGYQLLKVIRNITPINGMGRAIRLVSQDRLDSIAPNWHLDVGTEVIEYCFDKDMSRDTFYIYPSVGVGKKIEIRYSKEPPTFTNSDMAVEVPVSPVFSLALQKLIAYQLLSGDSASAGNGENHLNTAMTILGLKASADNQSYPSSKGGQ